MRHRFEGDRPARFPWTLILSVVIFAGIFLLFHTAVSDVSAKTAAEEELILEQALTRSIAHCYAIEGRYPESLEYLETTYGLTYDHQRFYVDYQPIGSDLWPDVTILKNMGAAP